jgi:serine/threonine protein kinase
MFDLRIHGFTNCVISEDLHDISNNLPHWEALPRTNKRLVGPDWWELLKVPLTDLSGRMFIPAFEWGQKIDEGTYGKIYMANRRIYKWMKPDASGAAQFISTQESITQVVIKESTVYLSPEELKMPYSTRTHIFEDEIQTLIHEAAVMTLAHAAVKKAGIPLAIPEVYEIFCHTKPNPVYITDISSVCISMEYIHGNTLLKYMRAHFHQTMKADNNAMFLHIVKQMANILSILQDTLRMNHRDIKINNILMRDSTDTIPSIVLIDYGFACIANGVQEPRAEMSKIEAGAYFGSRHACFKHGRDMCQFLFSLHCYFPFEMYLSERLCEVARTWLCVPYSLGVANLMNGLDIKGRPYATRRHELEYNEGIYLFLRREEVDPLQCSPKRILEDIAAFETPT